MSGRLETYMNIKILQCLEKKKLSPRITMSLSRRKFSKTKYTSKSLSILVFLSTSWSAEIKNLAVHLPDSFQRRSLLRICQLKAVPWERKGGISGEAIIFHERLPAGLCCWHLGVCGSSFPELDFLKASSAPLTSTPSHVLYFPSNCFYIES